MMRNVAIIGAGKIGEKRAAALDEQSNLLVVCDTNEGGARRLASSYNAAVETDWMKVASNPDVEFVIVSVVNAVACEIVSGCLRGGKHVLCEKPLGRNPDEARRMVNAAAAAGRRLKVGFNHRFHPALAKAKAVLDDGGIGELSHIRARYGHGGRPGMETEWRASKELCGGGELLDQGVHVIDLCRWFAGDVEELFGRVSTRFWEIEVEDNAFVWMKTASGAETQFHVSWTNWRNVFAFEVYGSDGYLNINGLGGWYGVERLEYGRRRPEGGVPDIQELTFDQPDTSWQDEWAHFVEAVADGSPLIGDGADGLAANEVIAAIYASNERGEAQRLLGSGR